MEAKKLIGVIYWTKASPLPDTSTNVVLTTLASETIHRPNPRN